MAEADRLAQARRHGRGDNPVPWGDGPCLMRARHRVTRERLHGSTVLLFLAAYEDGFGRVVEWTLVPVALPTAACFRRTHPSRARIADGLSQMDGALADLVARAAASWRAEAARVIEGFAACRLRRERAIAAAMAPPPRHGMRLQPGLFDRRAAAAFDATAAARRSDTAEHAARIAMLEQGAAVSFQTRLLLVIAP